MKKNVILIKYMIKILEYRWREIVEEKIINENMKYELIGYLKEWEEEAVLKAKTIKSKQKRRERYEMIMEIHNRLLKEGEKPTGRRIAKELNLIGFKCSNVTVTDVLNRHKIKEINVDKLYDSKHKSHRKIISKTHNGRYNRFLK